MSTIAYEASNQYSYHPLDLAEKALICRPGIKSFIRRISVGDNGLSPSQGG